MLLLGGVQGCGGDKEAKGVVVVVTAAG